MQKSKEEMEVLLESLGSAASSSDRCVVVRCSVLQYVAICCCVLK